MIYLSRPHIDGREIRAVTKVLRSGWLSKGQEVKKFEREFAKFIGVRYAISLNSCASALQLAIQALRLKGEIIVPSFTFVASVNAIINSNCTPRFIDIDYNTCNMNTTLLKQAINKNTVAIMPVHFAGQSCNMDIIIKIAKEKRLAIIEDSAEAIGAMYNKNKAGSFGIGCFSFFSTKNITCGEGGMVTTNDSRIRDDIATLSYHGIKKIDYERHKPWFKEAKYYGFNYRLSNVLAAIGLVQLSKIKYLNDKRREYAAYFNMELRECDELDLPIENLLCYHVYQMYTIKIKSDRVKRDLFVKTMGDKGIECGIHFYPPLHEQKLYKNYLRLDDYLPITEKVSNRIVSLPLYPGLRKKDLDYIVLRIKETLCKLKK